MERHMLVINLGARTLRGRTQQPTSIALHLDSESVPPAPKLSLKFDQTRLLSRQLLVTYKDKVSATDKTSTTTTSSKKRKGSTLIKEAAQATMSDTPTTRVKKQKRAPNRSACDSCKQKKVACTHYKGYQRDIEEEATTASTSTQPEMPTQTRAITRRASEAIPTVDSTATADAEPSTNVEAPSQFNDQVAKIRTVFSREEYFAEAQSDILPGCITEAERLRKRFTHNQYMIELIRDKMEQIEDENTRIQIRLERLRARDVAQGGGGEVTAGQGI